MKSCHKKVNGWFFATLTTLIIIGVGFASGQYFLVYAADGIVRNDYYANHKSIEPFYGQYKLDPNVVIHVREVVLAGGERFAPLYGKVLLLLHGDPSPGNIAFDLDYANCSMMRYLAREGWDTFAMDYEGYGFSTRPPLMDMPSAFPEAKAPIHSDVTVNNVERVVDFISNLRGVKKVHILGYSLGASREAPIYTINNQDRVVKLVLWAPGYMNLGFNEENRKWADLMDTKTRVLTTRFSLERFFRFGSNNEIIIPGAFEAFRDAMLASDPKSGELGGSVRSPAGRAVDLLRTKPEFDASKIKVPTLVIRGALDTFSTQADSQLLTNELGSEVKRYVEIPNASHFIHYEKANIQLFKAVKDFLEAKIEAKK